METSPDYESIFSLYQRSVSIGVLEYFHKQAGNRIRRGIYAAQVVLWLMIVQRLQAAGTLASAVQSLLQGWAEPLLQNCKRVREKRISVRTGGYCRARQRLPKLLCRQVMQEMLLQLRQVLGETGEAPVFVLDGSSLGLALISHAPPSKKPSHLA
jgi:hypothetical protein